MTRKKNRISPKGPRKEAEKSRNSAKREKADQPWRAIREEGGLVWSQKKDKKEKKKGVGGSYTGKYASLPESAP